MPELGADDAQLFNALTGFSKVTDYEDLLVAPVTLHRELIARIERETEHARAGPPAGHSRQAQRASPTIEVVRALYRASQAGVPIDLLVRGMCVLRPGVPGVSENIRVRSIVGRFLEHSRIFVVRERRRARVYIGSADWMGRNLDRRVELVVPVLDPVIAETLDVAHSYRSCSPTTSRAASCTRTAPTGGSRRARARCRSTRSASFSRRRRWASPTVAARGRSSIRAASPAAPKGAVRACSNAMPTSRGSARIRASVTGCCERLDVGDVDHEPDRLIRFGAAVEILALAIELREVGIRAS